MNRYLSTQQRRLAWLRPRTTREPIRGHYPSWFGRLLLASLFTAILFLVPSAQAATTSHVAYVFDFGSGLSDTTSLGSSIFMNVITAGSALPNGGTYNGAIFTDVPIPTIDASPTTALSGFDTVVLYQVCSIGSHPVALSAINTFLVNGGKVIILDSDRCAPGALGGGFADWSGFFFPFTVHGPGPHGGSGSYAFLEPNTLTAGLSLGPQPDDAVADANLFTSAAGAWCISISATNVLGDTGRVEAYARTVNGGLAIYSGEDFWFIFGEAHSPGLHAHLKTVFDNMLAQAFNPDGLPCTIPVTGITLNPLTATNPIGALHTVTATVVDSNGNLQAGVIVTFNVISGPDASLTGTGTTNGAGQATFAFTDTTAPGTDVVVASFTDSSGSVHTSNEVHKTWTPSADLSITKSDAPDPVIAGGNLTYTLNVTNNGPSDATGVAVTDSLPAGVSLVLATSSPGTCVAVTCDLGNLANGASATVTITVTVDASTPAGTITNAASVIGNENDPDTTNNTASTDTVIMTAPSLCPILDDFNRADGPLGSNWAGRTRGYRIRSNQVVVRRGRPIYWQPETYGLNQEACVTLTRINPKSKQHGLLLKVQEPNNWRKGAILVNYNGRSGDIEVKARDVANHKWILVGSFTPVTPVADGDQLRAKAFADGTVEVFINDTSLGTANAGSFYAGKGGQIGLWFRGRQADNDEDDGSDHDRSIQSKDHNDDEGDDDGPSGRPALFDDFGGGTIAAP